MTSATLMNIDRFTQHQGWSWSKQFSSTSALTGVDFGTAWLDEALIEIATLCKLLPNWDGQGAKEIASENIASANHIAAVMASLELDYPPAVVPTFDGGVQFEWASNNSTVELEISGPYEASLFSVTHGEEDFQDYLTADLALLFESLSTKLRDLYMAEDRGELMVEERERAIAE